MDSKNIVLNVNGIEVIYNHVILVLKGVSLQVAEGSIVAILGGNGAGKTTTLRAISNLLKGERGEVTKGSIELRGERIENLSPADLVKRGVVQVMEGRHCFAHGRRRAQELQGCEELQAAQALVGLSPPVSPAAPSPPRGDATSAAGRPLRGGAGLRPRQYPRQRIFCNSVSSLLIS